MYDSEWVRREECNIKNMRGARPFGVLWAIFRTLTFTIQNMREGFDKFWVPAASWASRYRSQAILWICKSLLWERRQPWSFQFEALLFLNTKKMASVLNFLALGAIIYSLSAYAIPPRACSLCSQGNVFKWNPCNPLQMLFQVFRMPARSVKLSQEPLQPLCRTFPQYNPQKISKWWLFAGNMVRICTSLPGISEHMYVEHIFFKQEEVCSEKRGGLL